MGRRKEEEEKMRRKILWRKGLSLFAAALLFAASGCERRVGEKSDSSASETDIVVTTAEETEAVRAVAALGVNGNVLPSVDGVTIDQNAEELAPVNLTVGVINSVVRDLQQRLMDLGYMDMDEPTTYYGDATSKAVQYFQRQVGMPMDGITGVSTWDALMADSAPHYAAKLGFQGNDITNVQYRLYNLGYLTEASQINGSFDAVTETAVAANLHQAGDVLADLAAKVALGGEVRVDVVADLRHLVLGEVLDAGVGVDARRLQGLVRAGASDPEDVGECDLDSLLARQVDTGNACHGVVLLCAPGGRHPPPPLCAAAPASENRGLRTRGAGALGWVLERAVQISGGPAPGTSALTLLVPRVLADDHDAAVATNHLAAVTDLLNARLDLHDVPPSSPSGEDCHLYR